MHNYESLNDYTVFLQGNPFYHFNPVDGQLQNVIDLAVQNNTKFHYITSTYMKMNENGITKNKLNINMSKFVYKCIFKDHYKLYKNNF